MTMSFIINILVGVITMVGVALTCGAAEVQETAQLQGRILKVAQMGHPVLARKAEIVDPKDHKVQFVADLIATFEDTGGTAVGLAAPQLHVSSRIIIVWVPKEYTDPSYPEGFPMTVMLNPSCESLSDEQVLGWEGCVSLPGMMGEVPRYRRIQYAYQNPQGDTITGEAEDYVARVLQHEIDHLDGIMYVQRISDMSRFGCVEEVRKYMKTPPSN